MALNTLQSPFLPRSRKVANARRPAFGLVGFCLLGMIGSCASNHPTSLELDQQLMTVETSPIPGAHATVLPATTADASMAADAKFCVTDAGYCPLAAAVPAGRNCLCETSSLSYGGKTGAAPQTYKAP